MPKNEQTSRKIAKLASRQLKSVQSTKNQKRVAGSALTQAPNKKK